MKEDFYISIIHKKLSGDISPSEAAELKDWLEADADHKLLAASIEKAWELGGKFQPELEVDLDADFAVLEGEMDQVEEEVAVFPLKPKRNWLAIAAAVAVLVVAGFLANNFLTPEEEWLVLETKSNQTERIALADGSEVILGENSVLKYPEAFSGKERNLELAGEAFFAVESNPEQPFIVDTKNGRVEVLGTSFTVRDYENETEMQVLVNTGKVKMLAKGLNKSLLLEKAEKGIYQKNTKELTELKEVSLNELAYYTKTLSFENTPLSRVIETLEDYFQVEFITKNLGVLDCPFTNTFNDKPLEFVLETIKTVFGLEYELEYAATYSLSGGSCR